MHIKFTVWSLHESKARLRLICIYNMHSNFKTEVKVNGQRFGAWNVNFRALFFREISFLFIRFDVYVTEKMTA